MTRLSGYMVLIVIIILFVCIPLILLIVKHRIHPTYHTVDYNDDLIVHVYELGGKYTKPGYREYRYVKVNGEYYYEDEVDKVKKKITCIIYGTFMVIGFIINFIGNMGKESSHQISMIYNILECVIVAAIFPIIMVVDDYGRRFYMKKYLVKQGINIVKL